MALQWMILAYMVAAEAAVAVLVTLPAPNLLRNRLVSIISLILQPAFFIVPFTGFQLLDIYWKYEHRLMCTSEVCTAAERDRYEKSQCEPMDGVSYKDGITSSSNPPECYGLRTCLLYWSIYRVCKYQKDVERLEEQEKRLKAQ